MTLTPAQIERYQRKAQAVIDAWGALFGASPTMRALARVMSVAEFESHLGDARGWNGEHNWGAITKRPLSAIERAALDARGISAEGGDTTLAAARSVLPAASDEALHIDRSPGRGHHFAWFWSFASDAEAAKKFLQVLVVQRPSVRAVLESDDLGAIARAMYETHYYEGDFTDAEANIRAYTARLAEHEPVISAALVAASPVMPPAVDDGTPSAWASAPRYAARTGAAGAHLFFGAIVLVFGGVLARGGHR